MTYEHFEKMHSPKGNSLYCLADYSWTIHLRESKNFELPFLVTYFENRPFIIVCRDEKVRKVLKDYVNKNFFDKNFFYDINLDVIKHIFDEETFKKITIEVHKKEEKKMDLNMPIEIKKEMEGRIDSAFKLYLPDDFKKTDEFKELKKSINLTLNDAWMVGNSDYDLDDIKEMRKSLQNVIKSIHSYLDSLKGVKGKYSTLVTSASGKDAWKVIVADETSNVLYQFSYDEDTSEKVTVEMFDYKKYKKLSADDKDIDETLKDGWYDLHLETRTICEKKFEKYLKNCDD